jgi:hypothetical protein
MPRRILDRGFHEWEVYPSTPRHADVQRSRILFHCLSDAARRPRFVEQQLDRASAEAFVLRAPAEELVEMLADAAELE